MARRLPITDRLLQQRCVSLLHCTLSTSLSVMIILLSLVQLDLQPWKTFLVKCVLVWYRYPDSHMKQAQRVAEERKALWSQLQLQKEARRRGLRRL